MTRFQILTVGSCGVVFLLDGFDGTALGYLAPSISESTKIPIQTFGPLFSAGVFGLMIAVLTTGPIADRWGRKWPVIGVPKRVLPVFVAVLFSGIPLGSMICGLVSSWMVPVWGWRPVLYLGGILPLAISLVLIVVLPESIQFLIVQGAPWRN